MRRVAQLLSLTLALGATACNSLTGADELTVGDDPEGEDTSGNGSGAGSGASVGSGTGGPGSGGSTGSGAVDPLADATGVGVREVAVYQGVKSTVFQNGAPIAPSVRIVAGRPALVRVFVDVQGLTGAPITARLYLGDDSPIEQTVTGLVTSVDDDLQTTINFDLDGTEITAGATWRVELREDVGSSAGPNPAASTPTGNLAAEISNALKITLIPVQYQADGSNRMPDTSASQIEGYRQLFMKLYPTTSVEVSVGQTLGWSGTVSPDGSGWDTLLNAISQERMSSSAGVDEFYYGVFNPASSLSNFCGGGCVSGLGFVGEPNGEYSRAAIGLGFSGAVSRETAVHELGHNHGRPHSPCGGASGADGQFPYSGGSIGVWGFDLLTGQLVPPTHKDFMGYCSPAWISDYVYEEILDFMQATGGQSQYVAPDAMDRTYDRVSFGPDGPTFLPPITMHKPPAGAQTTVTLEDESGAEHESAGTFFPYDHIDGGVLFVRQDGADRVRSLGANVTIAGKVKSVFASR